jgi:hypothetical protein
MSQPEWPAGSASYGLEGSKPSFDGRVCVVTCAALSVNGGCTVF